MANFQISRNYFTGNTSYSGMIGLYAYDSYGEIDHNMFLGNTATTGDMYIQQSSHVIFDHNFDELPDNGTVALRIVNSTDLIIDGEDIIGKSNSSAPGGKAVGTISLSGTWTASDTLAATIQPPFPIASPLVASITTTGTPESLPSAAASLANAINTSGAEAFLTATASGNNITLTSNFVGPTGNITGYFASSAYPTPTGSPAGIIVSPTAQATFAGGSEPPSYGMTIYDNASRHAMGQLVITGMNPNPAPQTINVVLSLSRFSGHLVKLRSAASIRILPDSRNQEWSVDVSDCTIFRCSRILPREPQHDSPKSDRRARSSSFRKSFQRQPHVSG